MKMVIFLIIIIFSTTSFANNTTLIRKGNGVIVDGVAQDIKCPNGMTNPSDCTSQLLITLKSNYNKPGQNFYIMPDFMSITQMQKNTLQPVYDKCTNYGKINPDTGKALYNAMDYILNYSALPLLNASDFASDGLAIPPNLGQCIPGKFVTKFYAKNPQNGETNYVLPMINGSAYELNTASDAQLITLADNIATIINADPNAKGVSFDLEHPSMSINVTTVFIGELAKQLAEKNKLVAIFDPKIQALSIVSIFHRMLSIKVLSSISNQYQNVIALVALYDYGLNVQSPYAPIPLSVYKEYTTDHAVPGYFGGFGKDTPVMFVLPATATTTLYESLNLFNKNFTKGPNPNIVTPPPTCNRDNIPEFLSTYLKSLILAVTPIDYFISQCKKFPNSSVKQEQYFSASLQAITDGYQLSDNPNKFLVGGLMYNHKPTGFYSISCAKAANNILGTESLHKKCLGFYPETIANERWQDLQNWVIPGNN